jgi:hypothetical protein
MKFKDYFRISEEQSGTDKGLMGFPVASSVRKPSDGQPFKNILGSASGQTPRGASGGGMAGGAAPAGGGMFMKKRMKKK